jgi:hypothetical protein
MRAQVLVEFRALLDKKFDVEDVADFHIATQQEGLRLLEQEEIARKDPRVDA